MQEFQTENIRNVLLIAHTRAGKSTLAEAMLFAGGSISRMGKVDDGNTVVDFEPEEIKRKSSISAAMAPVIWKKNKVNIIDVPGYFDFIGELMPALQVTDSAILLVCATSGVEVGTEIFNEYADQAELPRMVFINKIDRENADFFKTVGMINEKFGRKYVPIQLPIGAEDNFQGVFDLITMKPVGGAKADALPSDQIDEFRDKLLESVAEADDNLAIKYLESEEITEDEIRQALQKGIQENIVVPILVGSALRDKNIPELLDAICDFLPSPVNSRKINVHHGDSEETLPPEASGPLAALVFKTSTDPYVGKMNYLRVFSGSINSDSSVLNATKRKMERIGQLFSIRGKTQEPVFSISAGDIGIVAKLAETGTGDSLANQDYPVTFDPIRHPLPTLTVSIHPKTKADFDKLGTVLTRLNEEDTAMSIRKDPDTGETIISGYGEAQLEVLAEKMKRKFSLDAELKTPRIPYKETITTSVTTEYKHKKQTGGHGQYGHVMITIDPLPKGSGYEFKEKVVGGSIPKNYIPAVSKGLTEALAAGELAHCPIVDLKVTLYDGSYHPVDSSDMAFKIAASHALKKGIQQAQPVLLEPIMNIKISIPESYTGDVMGDLNGKRARIQGMNPQNGVSIVEAQVPLSEILRYSIDLRSITQGKGKYTQEFSHYEEVPDHIAQKIIASAAKVAKS